jgi:hypothetical protein
VVAGKKTLREWLGLMPDGIDIIDPDGFDRTDPMMMIREYTREEYLLRAYQCTILPHPMDGSPHRRWSTRNCDIDHGVSENSGT